MTIKYCVDTYTESYFILSVCANVCRKLTEPHAIWWFWCFIILCRYREFHTTKKNKHYWNWERLKQKERNEREDIKFLDIFLVRIIGDINVYNTTLYRGAQAVRYAWNDKTGPLFAIKFNQMIQFRSLISF